MAGASVIAFVLAVQLTTAPAATVAYGDVPQDVVRVSLFGWQDTVQPAKAAGDVQRDGDRVTIRAVTGHRALVLFERADGGYLLDGPFWWPAHDEIRPLDRRWRRTITAGAAEPIPGPPAFEWLAAGVPGLDAWPRCFQAGERFWNCWGALAGEPGVIVGRALERTWWTAVSRAGVASLQASRWARLLVVPDVAGASELRVRFAHPVGQSSQRVRGVRVATATVPGAQATAIAPGVRWLSGNDVPPGAWIDIRTSRTGPAYLALQEVADGPVSVPLTIQLDETRALDGLVVGSGDRRAGGALVTLFRLIDPPAPPISPARERPRRVLVAETIADDTGRFHLDGIGDAEHEVVAWHPQLGHKASSVPRSGGELTLRLESPGTVRGRVLVAGKPTAGVDVISLPGSEAVRTAEDVLDLKGGDTRTGADGRFVVMLAAAGGGELRVGGGAWPIRRFPLPRVPAPLVDLGDVDLGSPLEMTIVLDQESPCDVRATGPVGQTGLQIIMGARTGPGLFRIVLPEPGVWAFGLLCGHDPRALSPMTVQIDASLAGKEVRFSVR